MLGGGYGKALKQQSRSLYGSLVGFHGRGEMIPNPLSYCEIDKNTVDKWGIPVLKFRFQFSRSRRCAHGKRSEDVGAQLPLPSVGLQKPIRHRRGTVRQPVGQESYVDDFGLGVADI